MSTDLNPDHVKKFIRSFQVAYEERTLLSEICDRSIYEENDQIPAGFGDDGLEYIQIGRRTRIPVSILNQPVANSINVNSFARSIALGERNYVLDELNDSVEGNNVKTEPIVDLSFDRFQKWCGKISHPPDHLFLPSDSEYREEVSKWRKTGNYRFGREEAVTYGPFRIQIHWIPLDTGIKNGYLISSQGVSLVQKWFADGELEHPSSLNFDEQYNDYSKNRPLMIYLESEVESFDDVTEGTEERVEFLYRVVLSELTIENGSVIQLNPTRPLSNE